MRYSDFQGLIFVGILMLLVSCGVGRDAEAYIRHANRIVSIVRLHKHNTDTAGDAVLKYVTENKAALEAALTNLGDYSVKQTEAAYEKVMKPVRALKELVDKPQTMYPESIRVNINALLKENEEYIAEYSAQLSQTATYFLKSDFSPIAARLAVIRELAAETPAAGFALAANENFIAAMQIMKIENLVLE